MGVKSVVAREYWDIINKIASSAGTINRPAEGWIRTIRKALNMTSVQLAERAGISKRRLFKAEQAELTGAITILSMQNFASAMNCKFIYAIVPDSKIEQVISDQAFKKAQVLINSVNKHMVLENQGLSTDELKAEINKVTQKIINDLPNDLWDE